MQLTRTKIGVSSFFLSKAKRKKASAPEKPAKKQKSGETSRPSASAKSDRNNDDNMFQVELSFIDYKLEN